MLFTALAIPGAFLLEQEPHSDDRGTFARQFCQREMEKAGIPVTIRQCNMSYSKKRGTVRGLHYQKDPHPEPKILTCICGSIFDVMVDLRQSSPMYLKPVTMELREGDGKSLYIPPNIAHGFQTLEDDTRVFYQLGEFFYPEDYAGVRFNDPKIGVTWPIGKGIIVNERDANYPLL